LFPLHLFFKCDETFLPVWIGFAHLVKSNGNVFCSSNTKNRITTTHSPSLLSQVRLLGS
jgi:hypothetical protein